MHLDFYDGFEMPCPPSARELRRFEIEDNEIENAPTCPDCGTHFSRQGVCVGCVLRDQRPTHLPYNFDLTY